MTLRGRGGCCVQTDSDCHFHGTKRRHCLLLPSRTLPTHWRRPTRSSQIATSSQVERGVRRVLLRPDRVVRAVLDAWLALHGVVQRRVLHQPCAQREPVRSERPLTFGRTSLDRFVRPTREGSLRERERDHFRTVSRRPVWTTGNSAARQESTFTQRDRLLSDYL